MAPELKVMRYSRAVCRTQTAQLHSASARTGEGDKTYQILNGSLLQKLLRRLQLIPICQQQEGNENEC